MRRTLTLTGMAAFGLMLAGVGGTASKADAAVVLARPVVAAPGPRAVVYPAIRPWCAPRAVYAPGPVVVAPAPAVYRPVVVAPRPVVFAPRPIVVGPRPVFARPVGYRPLAVGVGVGRHHGHVNVGVGGIHVGVGW